MFWDLESTAVQDCLKNKFFILMNTAGRKIYQNIKQFFFDSISFICFFM